MSAETETVTKPVDEAIVVHDQPVDQEKAHDDLVADVTKLLDKAGETPEPDTKPDTTSETPPKGEEPAKAEGEKEEGPELAKELQSRVKEAGLPEGLAERLNQAGQLEETLAAFDRSMIERSQAKTKPKEEPLKAEKTGEETPPSSEEVPALDPDVYDEDLVKRDNYQQKRIGDLESKLQGLIEQQSDGFDEWFDGTLTDLGCNSTDEEKCQEVFKAYGAVCDAFGKDPSARDKVMVERAYAAMYPQDVFKQNQQQTVDRLRDVSGKFLSSPKTKGAPPSKGATEEERHDTLVSNVGTYLKEQGVEMSGY